MLLGLLLVGCARIAPQHPGKHGRPGTHTETAFARLEKGVLNEPKNVEHRLYLLRQREVLIHRLLLQADKAKNRGRLDAAEAKYRTALKLDVNNQRAATGLAEVRSRKEQNALLTEAARLLKKGDVLGAGAILHSILVENPKQSAAKKLLSQLNRRVGGPRYFAVAIQSKLKKPISLEFRDARLRSVFEIISRTAGINFIFDRDVRPNIKTTIFVKNSTIQSAIRFILLTSHLKQKILNKNTILIYPDTPAKDKEYQELMVKAFFLANANVQQVLTMIRTLVKTRDIFIDKRLNLLVMRDTPQAIHMAAKLIAADDLAEPEVVLDVEVLEVKRSKLTELGIQYPNKFSVLGAPFYATTATGAGGVSLVTSAPPTNLPLTLEGLKHVNANQIGIPNPILNLRAEDSDVKLLANPRIRVEDREDAKIHIGDRVPVITTTSTANVGVSESVNYLDVGLKLDVKPHVYLDNEVGIKVSLEVSNIVREIKSSSGTLTYQVGTRNASTTLRLKDGETQALAGLINDEDRASADKVPGLGDIPILGRLFSSHRNNRTKTEVILLITPHIVRNIDHLPASTTEFLSGTADAVGEAPLVLHAASSRAPNKASVGRKTPPSRFPAARPQGIVNPVNSVRQPRPAQ